MFELLRDQSGSTSAVGLRPESDAKPLEPVAVVAPSPAAKPKASVAMPPPTSVPAPATEPAREPKPLSDAPAMEISTPRYVAEPVRPEPGEPEMPDLSGLEPEPVVSRSEEGRVSFSLSVSTLAGIIGAALVALVVFGASLYSLGGRDSKEELQPILGDQANRALEASDPPPLREPPPPASRDTGDREPIRDANVVLAPEAEDPTPVPLDPPAESSGDASETAAAETTAKPDSPANVDTRQAGLNYMYTSRTFDRDEAVRAQQFLFDNDIDSIVEELVRESDGQKAYRIWTLVGIPGQGFNTSREKFEHERAIFDLGNAWLTEHGGRLDFSRPGQIGWIKYGG